MGEQLDLLAWRPSPVDQGPKKRATRKPKARPSKVVELVAPALVDRAVNPFHAAAHAWFHRTKEA